MRVHANGNTWQPIGRPGSQLRMRRSVAEVRREAGSTIKGRATAATWLEEAGGVYWQVGEGMKRHEDRQAACSGAPVADLMHVCVGCEGTEDAHEEKAAWDDAAAKMTQQLQAESAHLSVAAAVRQVQLAKAVVGGSGR